MKKFISIIISLILISSSAFIPAFAQMNPLNNTEKSNIDLVIKNLHNLTNSIENLIKSTKNKKTIQELEDSKKLYEKITQNIEAELKGGKIVSVPGLDDSKNKKYRHDGELGSPKAAFCGDGKTQVKDASGKWVDCPKGNMLVDKKFLDPLNGNPINESTQDGWQKKWELAHILVHEKAHELMINEQIAEFQKQKWWNELPQSEKDKKIELAIGIATTVGKHGQVYLVQKNLLKVYEEVLKDQKKHLEDEKKSLKNTAANKPRITQINSLISDIDFKIKWLDKTWSNLEDAMGKATKGSEFGHEHCGWPLDFHSGVVAISVTFPAGYERFDLSVENDNVVDVHITKSEWYGKTILVEPILEVPTLYMQMPDTVFSGQFIQPEVCQYLDWATNQGLIEISIDPISDDAIPDWIKSNVKWWSDGIVSDREFANSVGFLVKENVIKVNLPINSDGTIKISENLVIPSWIKNNAKWWSDGMTSDQEFTSAIEYMINQNIISFSDRTPILSSVDDLEFFENLYGISMWNEAAFASLASINDAEVEILGDLAADAWNEYHLTNNPQEMDNAKSFELLLDKQDSLTLHIQNLQVLAKNTSEQVKTIAKIYGSQSADLNSIAESAQKKIDHPIKISNIDNLNKGLDEFDILDKMAMIPGVNPYNFLADQIIDNQDIINLINEAEIQPGNLGFLNSPGLTVEDRIMLLLMEIMKNMDKQISEQADKIQSLNSGTTNPSASADSTLDVESMKLKRLTDKRGQLFDISRQIIDRYDETAKGTIQSLRDGGSVTEKETTEPTESPEQITPPQDTQQGKQVVVLVIGGKYYPLSQFFDVPAHTPNCDAMHYHSEFSKVRSIDGVLISDPNQSTCGFGKVGLIPVDVVFMTQDQIDSFKDTMGIEP